MMPPHQWIVKKCSIPGMVGRIFSTTDEAEEAILAEDADASFRLIHLTEVTWDDMWAAVLRYDKSGILEVSHTHKLRVKAGYPYRSGLKKCWYAYVVHEDGQHLSDINGNQVYLRLYRDIG